MDVALIRSVYRAGDAAAAGREALIDPDRSNQGSSLARHEGK